MHVWIWPVVFPWSHPISPRRSMAKYPPNTFSKMVQSWCKLTVVYFITELPTKRHCGDGYPKQIQAGIGQVDHEEPHCRDSGPSKRNQQEGSLATKNEDLQTQWDDGCSVFISNLSFSLQEPEEQLRNTFQTCGTIKQVRPVFSGRGTFRGYCYVQFQDPLAVAAALKLDRQELDGRPMFVSPCIDKKKNQDFKVSLLDSRNCVVNWMRKKMFPIWAYYRIVKTQNI